MSAPRKAVVIGGGISGLASAALLAREGYDVDLFEQGEQLGGRAGRWSRDGFRFDTGPSWYLMPDVFDHFFRLMGTTTQRELDLVRLDPAYRVFFEDEGQPLDVRSGHDEVIALFEQVEPGAGRAMARYLESARTTYDLAVQRFLYTSFESFTPLVRRDVVSRLGRLGRLLAQPLDRFVAAHVSDSRLQQVLGYPAVFLGTSPGRAPSMYHLMSHLDLVDGVRYPRGGFSRLVDTLAGLAEGAGARLHTGATVTRVVTELLADGPRRGMPGAHLRDRALRRDRVARATGVMVRDGGDERFHAADVVVAAHDLHHLESALLPAELRDHSARWWDRRDPGPGAVLVMLGVRGGLPELAHHSLFFTRNWQEHFDVMHGSGDPMPDPASIYVSRTSATDPSAAPQGCENLFILVPVTADPGLGRGGEDGAGDPGVEQIADAAISQVAQWAGIPDLAARVVVRRTIGPGDFSGDLNAWRGGALGPAHTVTQSAFLRGRISSRRVAGLLYAGASTIPGIGLPMCLISAEVMLKSLRGDVSTGPLAEPALDEGRPA
ncbi:phytoene desaturase family protein [Knoellia sp. Soil729]|uniref:phytoene desaturase family protein n=1 Tax=Knoellia sp. Soil729 TaxID=1736394 RepID=UPI0006F5A868|nr:phytoene desaturase family protein [Knoellia sp. Soil729]KRE42599.1 phytoene dehydrogenase [Knoellia sp. Soil729]